MSFRNNLQHLRATRNMTQEQLAMLLGVSRQSVSKWEAERAYPEMDKLLKLCDLFGCTLDELVTGDLTVRPTEAASSMPPTKAPQDVTGYDQAMRSFAWRLPLGIAFMIAGVALTILFLDPAIVPNVAVRTCAYALVFVGAALGLAFVLPAAFQRSSFRKAHPFVEDFYTADQKSKARTMLLVSLVAGIGLLMAGAVAAVLLQVDVWFAAAAFFLFAAVGVFVIVRGSLLGTRCNVRAYNEHLACELGDAEIDALCDAELQAHIHHVKRKHGAYSFIMLLATIVALVLLFVPIPSAQRVFFLPWIIGGLLCGVVSAYYDMQAGK